MGSGMKVNDFILLVQKTVCKVKRTQENEHLKSKYADLEDVLELLNPLLFEHGVRVEQYPDFIDGQWVMRTEIATSEDVKYYSHPLLGLENSKTPMQSLGSAETYARRYTLKGIFKLVDSDDDGNAVTPSGQPSKPARKSEVDKMARAFAAIHVSKAEIESICQSDLEDLTVEDMGHLKRVFQLIKDGEKTKADFLSGETEWQA